MNSDNSFNYLGDEGSQPNCEEHHSGSPFSILSPRFDEAKSPNLEIDAANAYLEQWNVAQEEQKSGYEPNSEKTPLHLEKYFQEVEGFIMTTELLTKIAVASQVVHGTLLGGSKAIDSEAVHEILFKTFRFMMINEIEIIHFIANIRKLMEESEALQAMQHLRHIIPSCESGYLFKDHQLIKWSQECKELLLLTFVLALYTKERMISQKEREMLYFAVEHLLCHNVVCFTEEFISTFKGLMKYSLIELNDCHKLLCNNEAEKAKLIEDSSLDTKPKNLQEMVDELCRDFSGPKKQRRVASKAAPKHPIPLPKAFIPVAPVQHYEDDERVFQDDDVAPEDLEEFNDSNFGDPPVYCSSPWQSNSE